MIHECLDSSVKVFNNNIQSEVVFSSLSVSLSNLYSADLFTSAWKHIFIINIRIFFALIVAVMNTIIQNINEIDMKWYDPSGVL